MKFSTREEINAPIDDVFSALVDFEALEARITEKGGTVERLDDLQTKGPGMTWKIAFTFRGSHREVEARMSQYKPYEKMRVETDSDGLSGDLVCNLSEMGSGKTQMNLTIDLKPKTLSARLLVQSMKLAKGTMNKRFKERVASFGREVEDKLKQAA